MSFIVSAAPIWSRLARKALGNRSINEAAVERVEISTAYTVEELPALALPGEFSRARNARHHTLAELARLLEGQIVQHPATVAFRLRDAIIADGTVYVGTKLELIAQTQRRAIIFGRSQEYETAQLCADIGSDLFFGRWLCDSLAKEILANERGLQPINQGNRLRMHEIGYRAILKLMADQPKTAVIRNLWVVDDRGYNADHVRRFRLLRQRMRSSAPNKVGAKVYLTRGVTGVLGRAIENESEVVGLLEALGFSVLRPELMNPAEIRAALISARIVVAVEGSVLAHAQVTLPEGSAILVIQPADRFSVAHKSVAEAAKLRFGYVVAESKESGLWVDIGRLRRTLDLVEESI